MSPRFRLLLRVAAFVAAGLLVVMVAIGAWYRFGPRHVPQGQPALVTLREGDPGPVRDAFNAAKDSTRVLVLLSPT